MQLPWYTPDKLAKSQSSSSDYYAFASRFEVSSLAWSVRFMVNTARLVNQMRKAPGCISMSLEAKFFKGHFYTASVWKDEAALRAFASSEPHRSIAKALAPSMKKSTFRSWTMSDDDLPLDWKAVKEVLDAPR